MENGYKQSSSVAHKIIRRTKIFSSWCVGSNFSSDYNDADLDENVGGGVTNLIGKL